MAIDGLGSFNPALFVPPPAPAPAPAPGVDRSDGKQPPAGGSKDSPDGKGGDVPRDADGKPIDTKGQTDGSGSSDSEGGDNGDGKPGVSDGKGTEGVGGSKGAGGTGDVDGKGKVDAPAPPPAAKELDLHALIDLPAAGGQLPPSLQVPQIPPPANLGNLSTSDLIQLVRTEARKTAQELIKATAEVIKAQQIQIQALAEGKIKQLNENIKKQEEAEEKKKAMDILKYVMYAVSALVIAIMAIAAVASAPFSGGATLGVLVAVSTAMLLITVMATEIKDEEGKSGMDKMMEGMAEGLGKMWPNSSQDKQKENGMITAAALIAAIQVTIAVVMLVATLGSGTGAATAQVASGVGRAISSGLQAAAGGVQAALNISMKTMEAAAKMAQVAMKVLSIVQALSTISTSATKIAVAVEDYKVAVGKSQIEELKALIKLLNAMLESDMDFLKQLMEIQAKLDQGVSNLIKNEHETSIKIADIQQLA
jgi:hypothetical protein